MKKFVLLTILFAAFLVPQCVKAVDMEGFYVGATGAANFLSNTKRHHGRYERGSRYQTGFFGAIDLGYRWCSGFHMEAEVAYRYNRAKRHRGYDYNGLSTRRHRGHRDVWAAMVNVLYDINMCWCVEPYVGVGIGYAHVRNGRNNNFYGYGRRHHHRDDNQFAWQVIAGVAYPICDNIDLAVEYRFFDTTTRRHERNVYNNDIGVNLKYYF
ncbi:MAG: hypothetical protein BGO14_02900 [Chlamydiales bacterium 38-26]|nr:porin family protein [Chlamydiales bacterium]OJV09294.1 MAG: hypothetical protein BGO14_02900 [Chlamydiales bacterium 38-26]